MIAFRYRILIFIILLVVSANGSAAALAELDLCRTRDGFLRPIQKLVCDSHPALIEASNPGLKIPNCESKPMPKVLPETSPVSSVFVSCSYFHLESCKNIASELLKRKTGATVNILVNSEQLEKIVEVQAILKELRDTANRTGSPFNIIPVENQVPKFMRDPALLTISEGQNSYTSLPYSKDTGVGDALTQEVARLCGYKYDSSYAHLAEFDSAYSMIGQQNAVCRTGQFSTSCEKTPGTNTANSGGNFLAAPNGTLFVGENRKHSPDQGIVDFFRQGQIVKIVKIPDLVVGHIDEVIRFIPAQNSCGFRILRASPVEMKKYLKVRPLSEKYQLEWGKPTQVETILEDEGLMGKWDENEKIIKDAVDQISIDLAKSKPDCKPEIIALPVLWNSRNEVSLPNPVNALTVNGHYFFSGTKGTSSDELKSGLDAYQDFVEGKLHPLFSHPPVAVNTQKYNGYKGGNFHCATTNVFLPCK